MMSNNNLIIPLEIDNQPKTNYFKSYNYKEMKIKYSKSYLSLLFFSFFPFSATIAILSYTKFDNLIEILTFIGLIFIGLLWIFLVLWLNSNYIILRKDELNNLLQLQEKNCFNYTRNSLKFNLQNIIGDILFYQYKTQKQKKQN